MSRSGGPLRAKLTRPRPRTSAPACVSALSNVCGGGWPLTAVLPPAVPTTRHWGPLRGRLSGLRPRTSALAGVSGLSKRVRRSLRLNLLYAGDRRMDRVSRTRSRPRRTLALQVADRLAVSSDLIYLVWRHKLWWMVPLLVAMVVLAALVVIEATPIGPLLYPVF